MSKKNNTSSQAQKEEKVDLQLENKEPVLSALSGIFIILVTVLGDIGITRYILHKWNQLTIDFTYMIYETALTVICSAGLIVFFNYIRVGEACEKAQSMEEFPCGGPFGFLARNPVILWVELSIIMGILFTGINALLFRLLGFASWNTVIFLFYKIVYCCVMVTLTHWAALGRMLQPDWIQRKMTQKAPINIQKPQYPKNKKINKEGK